MNRSSPFAATVLVSGGLGLAGLELGAGIAHCSEGRLANAYQPEASDDERGNRDGGRADRAGHS